MIDIENTDAFYDFTALRKRGWTKRLVQRFLGEPDQMPRVVGSQSGRPQNLYSAKRVAHIELSDPDFIAEKRRTELYASRLKGVQGAKKKNLAAMVDAMTLPDLGLQIEELLQHAEKKREAEENLALVTKERVALEVLLASMKPLAWRLEIFQGHAGIRDARILLLKRMLAHIVTRYPSLSETANEYADESAGAGTERKYRNEEPQSVAR